MAWKKGRGTLGPVQPLFGRWMSDGSGGGPAGMRCQRTIEPFGKDYVRLSADWGPPGAPMYREIAMIGKGDDGALTFWSFTNDGKRSQGKLVDASDIHAEAVAFEAQMPAGTARMVYWPTEEGEGFYWAVESKTKKGWNRFMRHRYTAV